MADNRMVIKINYDKDHRKEVIDPKIVTVWHRERILAALSVAVLLIVVFVWLLSDDGQKGDGVSSSIELVDNQVLETKQQQHNEQNQSPATANQISNQQARRVVVTNGAAIIYDKHVIRASLNSNIKDQEPGQILRSAVTLEPGKTQELFYFSETKTNNSGILFHQWLKDGQQMHRKQVDKQKSKFVSKYSVGQKEIGHWKVELIDKKGKIYSQVEFNVGLQ